MTATDVPVGQVQSAQGDVRLRTLTATLAGARVPLRDVLSGTVSAVPVDRVDARVLLPYDALDRSEQGLRVTVSAAGERLRVRGSVRVLGRDLRASALSRLSVDGDVLVVTAQSFDVGSDLADRVVSGALGDRFDLRVDLGGLPYGLRVDEVRVADAGLEVRARAVGTVLSPLASAPSASSAPTALGPHCPRPCTAPPTCVGASARRTGPGATLSPCSPLSSPRS